MDRKLDRAAAVAMALATVGLLTAAATLATRGPCHEGDGRLLDPVPALPWVFTFLAVVAGWRVVRTMRWFPWPRPHRLAGTVASIALLIVTAFISFLSAVWLLDALGNPTAGCWSF